MQPRCGMVSKKITILFVVLNYSVYICPTLINILFIINQILIMEKEQPKKCFYRVYIEDGPDNCLCLKLNYNQFNILNL